MMYSVGDTLRYSIQIEWDTTPHELHVDLAQGDRYFMVFYPLPMKIALAKNGDVGLMGCHGNHGI
jgi:hypothetical protein